MHCTHILKHQIDRVKLFKRYFSCITLQTDVQRYQNMFNYKQSLIDSILPLIVVVFVGSLSDRFGRKPFLLAVLAGFVCMVSVYILVTLNPSWPVEVLFAGTLFVDSVGSWVVFNMVVYSYVADITSPENRAKRMGLLDAVWYMGGPVGNLLGGWLFRWFGFLAVFTLSALLWAVCFLYILMFIPESVSTRSRSYNAAEAEKSVKWGPLKNVAVLVKTAFRKREGNVRSLIFSLLALKLMVFLTQGHQMYLWSRKVLQWGATEFSTFSSVDFFIHQIGMVGWMLLAAKIKLHETVIAIGGLVSQGLWCAVLAIIPGPSLWWLVIIASVLGMFESSIEPAIRAMLTALVGENESGKILAFNGLLEAIWLIVDRTIFTTLYNTFVEIFPQINLVVQGGVCVVLVLVLLFLRRIFKRQPTPAPSLRTLHIINE
ncbi:hypothetical protein SK128_007788 [Halocaridina rubra]|uniref:Major facilitator superfamily (MFS) profile domain-containing protein n=1 Tax=Halocaridina rubra TaxID=373956 RepID=A0AAN9A134_HALRR